MNKQSTRRRVRRAAARTVAVGVAVAALVAILGAGPALAIQTPPDERILERQGRVNHQAAASQADQQGKADETTQGSPTETRPWSGRPEPKMEPGPWIDSQPTAPRLDGDGAGQPRRGLVIGAAVAALLLAVAALLLAVGAATIWRVRHRRLPPEPSQADSTLPELTHTDSSA
jgi:hypothetical protein